MEIARGTPLNIAYTGTYRWTRYVFWPLFPEQV